MNELSKRYKERTPMETVQIINDFFESNGFTLDLVNVNQSEAGTWYCHIDLYKGDSKAEFSHGKGMTKEFAIASAYGELYERFCNKQNYFASILFNRSYVARNKEVNGYYFSPNEKLMSYDELMASSHRTNHYFNTICDSDPDLIYAALDYITDGQGVGVPMHNIDSTKAPIYMDPRVLFRISRSNGMSAGNTLNEALVQALSEVVERDAQNSFYKTFSSIPHYAIKLDSIKNENLQKVFHNLKELGYDFYLFDLSYNFNTPVIMSLLVDKINGTLNINFGAFPVFDIAAERVCTELYQGIKSYHEPVYKTRLQKPFRSFDEKAIFNLYSNSISGEIFDGDFFKTIEYVDSYNKNCFTDQNHSNDELVQYFVDLANKIGDIQFYYFNTSLIPEVSSVYVMIENNDNYDTMEVCEFVDIKFTDISKIETLQVLKRFKELNDALYNGTPFDIRILMSLINTTAFSQGPTVSFIDHVMLWNEYSIERFDNSRNFFIPFTNDIIELPFWLPNTIYHHEYKKLMTLKLYVASQKYSVDDLLYIFNTIFNYGITKEDIYNCMSYPYLLRKIYIEQTQNYIQSTDYKDIINLHINNKYA